MLDVRNWVLGSPMEMVGSAVARLVISHIGSHLKGLMPLALGSFCSIQEGSR
jgi:hypothetical protein